MKKQVKHVITIKITINKLTAVQHHCCKMYLLWCNRCRYTVQYTQLKYRDFSTKINNRMMLNTSVRMLFITFRIYFSANVRTKSSMELVWKYGRLPSTPLLKSFTPVWDLPFSEPKFLFHSTFYSIPFHTTPYL